MALPPEDRQRLAERLLSSLPGAEEFEAELRRRMDEIDSGRVAAIPWDEGLARILGSKRD